LTSYSNNRRLSVVFWTVALAAVLFLLCGFGYHGTNTLATFAGCLYLHPECSVAAGTWAGAFATSFALIAAVSAYFLEVQPVLACRQLPSGVDQPARRNVVNVYVTGEAGGDFDVLVNLQPAGYAARAYGVATCSFSNAGRSPLIGLTAKLEVVRPGRRKIEEVPLDFLTASGRESERFVHVLVHRARELEADTTVRWTGAAAANGRGLHFAPPPALTFATTDRWLPAAASVPGGGGF
jgi:hypothetical protein